MSQAKRNLKTENLIAIANLLLTAIIGIGIAIYLRVRDERFQRNLLTLQAEINRQSNLAHLQVKPTCLYYTSCAGAIKIENTGPASAKNIKITIVLDEVDDEWLSAISDINSFKVKIFPPSFSPTITVKKVDVLYAFQDMRGDNAIDIELGTLPPNASIKVLLTANLETIPINSYEVEIPITVDFREWKTYVFYEGPIRQYLENRFSIANFSVTTFCENCEGASAPVRFVDSALQGFSMKTDSMQRGQNFAEMQTTVNARYILPKGVPHTPSSPSVYLKVVGTNEYDFVIESVSESP